MEIIEKAPAKINLSLDTPFRHLDGAPRVANGNDGG